MLKEKILLIVMLSMLICLIPTSMVNVQADEKTVDELQAELDAMQNENKNLENQEIQAEQDLTNYNDKIDEIEAEIDTLDDQNNQIKSEINIKNQEIDEIEAEIPEKKDDANQMLQFLEVLDNKNVAVEFVFSNSIQNTLRQIHSMNILVDIAVNTINDLIILEQELEKDQIELDIAAEQLKAHEIELEQNQELLEVYISEQTNIIASASDQQAILKQDIESQQRVLDFYTSQGCSGNDVYGQDCGPTNGGSEVIDASGFIRPTNNGYVTCEYGGYSGHAGIDVGSTNKTEPIYAVAPGVVVDVEYDNGGPYGNNVLVRHDTSSGAVFSHYAHMSSISVSPGQSIDYNTQIGNMGATGNVTGTHLDLEIRPDSNGDGYGSYSEAVNPRGYINFPAGPSGCGGHGTSWSSRT